MRYAHAPCLRAERLARSASRRTYPRDWRRSRTVRRQDTIWKHGCPSRGYPLAKSKYATSGSKRPHVKRHTASVLGTTRDRPRSARLEQQHRHLPHVEVHVVPLLVRHVRSKVAPHEAVPHAVVLRAEGEVAWRGQPLDGGATDEDVQRGRGLARLSALANRLYAAQQRCRAVHAGSARSSSVKRLLFEARKTAWRIVGGGPF